ncbi:hypothetical protein Pmani_009021, partial [Petrolisthes manimaculis]
PPEVELRMGPPLEGTVVNEDTNLYLTCHVDANPPPHKLIFKHQGVEVYQDKSARVLVNGNNLVLNRIRRTQAGEYSCSGTNSEGTGASTPLNLTVLSPPSAPVNCTLSGVGQEVVRVSCQPGHPSSMPQTYRLQIYESNTMRLYHNVTNHLPRFVVRGLTSGQDYMVYVASFTPYGHSPYRLVEAFTYTTAENRMRSQSTLADLPTILTFVGGVGGIVVLVVIVIAFIRLRIRKRSHKCVRRTATATDSQLPKDSGDKGQGSKVGGGTGSDNHISSSSSKPTINTTTNTTTTTTTTTITIPGRKGGKEAVPIRPIIKDRGSSGSGGGGSGDNGGRSVTQGRTVLFVEPPRPHPTQPLPRRPTLKGPNGDLGGSGGGGHLSGHLSGHYTRGSSYPDTLHVPRSQDTLHVPRQDALHVPRQDSIHMSRDYSDRDWDRHDMGRDPLLYRDVPITRYRSLPDNRTEPHGPYGSPRGPLRGPSGPYNTRERDFVRDHHIRDFPPRDRERDLPPRDRERDFPRDRDLVRERDLPPRERDLPPRERDLPPRERDLPPRERDLPTRDRDLPTRDRDLPPRERDLPPRERDLIPPRERDLPHRKSDLPTRKSDLPTRDRDLPPRERDLAPRERDLAPRERDLPPRERELIARERDLPIREVGGGRELPRDPTRGPPVRSLSQDHQYPVSCMKKSPSAGGGMGRRGGEGGYRSLPRPAKSHRAENDALLKYRSLDRRFDLPFSGARPDPSTEDTVVVGVNEGIGSTGPGIGVGNTAGRRYEKMYHVYHDKAHHDTHHHDMDESFV